MAITYDAPSNTITVTGYTEAVPGNLTDIYNADVAGAWGKVTRQCTNQFCFDCRLQIGDGSTTTWMADTSKHITFIVSPLSNQIITVKNNAHFRLGKLEGGKRTSSGCSFLYTYNAYAQIKGDTGSYFESYSSNYISLLNRLVVYDLPNLTMYNNILGLNTEFATGASTNLDIYNLNLQKTNYPVAYPRGTWDKIIFSDVLYGVYISTSPNPMLFKNASFLNNTHIAYINNSTTNHLYLVNTTADNWIFSWNGTSTKYTYRQYEFDLKVIDKDNVAINGATVKVWDKDSTLIVDTTTNASGVIATQTITRGYYNQANGNTLQEASPHLIKIEKAGYTTYEADFTLEDKIDWLIALQAAGGGLMRNPPMTGGMV